MDLETLGVEGGGGGGGGGGVITIYFPVVRTLYDIFIPGENMWE